jgi:hypothetical protein
MISDPSRRQLLALPCRHLDARPWPHITMASEHAADDVSSRTVDAGLSPAKQQI